jgi:putative iron-regulated protein
MIFEALTPAPFEERSMNRASTLRGNRKSRGLWAAFAAATVFCALPAAADTDPKAVIATYADIALAGYEDALTTARALDGAADALIAKPSAETLATARRPRSTASATPSSTTGKAA